MNRLAEIAKLDGPLMTLDQPHLIERYNRALAGFGLPPVGRASIEIDMTGFSPQVAADLGDPDYLDPGRVNRRFVILSPDQQALPVLNSSFSNTAGLMHEFFRANARAINALTIKDVIYGEIEDSVARVETLEDLLSINEVRFSVLSADDLLGKAGELRGLADRLQSDPEAWRDDALLERMVALAKVTGDIRQNMLVPDKLVFRHDAFWANHFGGVFVFVDEKITTVICDPAAPGFRRSRPWQVSYIGLDDPARIFDFLAQTGRIELPRASWVESSGLFTHRAQMVLAWLAGQGAGAAGLAIADPVWFQAFAQANSAAVAADGRYPFLKEMQRTLAARGALKIEEVAAERRFMLVRARPEHRDRWLTNRLIVRFNGSDVVSRFIFDKQGFYDAYQGFSDGFRAYVATTLASTYLQDKGAFRKRLYGIGDDENA